MTKKQPLLTFEEEKQLHERMLHGDEEAFERLVLANLGLAVYIVKRLPHWNLSGSMTREDLIQEANIALMGAIRTWKPTHRLATYARGVIYSKVFRAIENQEHLIAIPVNVQEGIRRLYKAKTKLTQGLGREPTQKELVEASGLSETQVRDLLLVSHRQPISLDALNNDRLAEEVDHHD
jgi:DNA-directed RNA polymerase sigma subunit (sigma70/sigma32)